MKKILIILVGLLSVYSVYAFTRFNEMFFGKTKCFLEKASLDILVK